MSVFDLKSYTFDIICFRSPQNVSLFPDQFNVKTLLLINRNYDADQNQTDKTNNLA